MLQLGEAPHMSGSPIIRTNPRIDIGSSVRSKRDAAVCAYVPARYSKTPCAASRRMTRSSESGFAPQEDASWSTNTGSSPM